MRENAAPESTKTQVELAPVNFENGKCAHCLGTQVSLSEDKCKQEGGQRFLKKQIKEPEPPSAFFTLDIGVATGA